MLHWNTSVAFEIGIFEECWWFSKILQFQSCKECHSQSKLHLSRRSRTVQPTHDLAQKTKSNSWISTVFIIYHQNSLEFDTMDLKFCWSGDLWSVLFSPSTGPVCYKPPWHTFHFFKTQGVNPSFSLNTKVLAITNIPKVPQASPD